MKNILFVLTALTLFSCNRPEQYKKHEKEKERVIVIDKNILPDHDGDPRFILELKDSVRCYCHEAVSDSLYYNVDLGDTMRIKK